MNKQPIPTCYFPSTTLFLDDDHDFLLNFVLQLDEGVAYRIFDAPRSALDYIHHKGSELNLVRQHCLSEYKSAKNSSLTLQNGPIHPDLAAIYAEVYNPSRFSEVSVVVIDYAMPGMNGLEFCRRIENSNIKKILLTGQADEKLAITAFNEGLIHRYIKKSDINAAQLITQSILELQQQYFQSMSNIVTRLLSITPPPCLYDQKFIAFFNKIKEENRIIEYYLMDHSGSFFMLDDDANAGFFIVKGENDLRMHCELARVNGASNNIVEDLAQGNQIPVFSKSSALNTPLHDDFSDQLIPAQRLVADKTYYYAYLQGNERFDIRQQKILSYHRYLEELDAEELLMESNV